MEFGKYVEQLMDAREWKPARLAKEAGISRTYVVNILEGAGSTGKPPKVTIDVLLGLSDALRIHPMKLILAYQGKDPEMYSQKESLITEDDALLESFQEFLRTRKKP